MSWYSICNIAYFTLVMLGMLAGIGLAVVLALAVKKVKNGMWIGLCAVGMVLMVIAQIARIALMLAGDMYALSVGNVLRDLAAIAAYLCAAGFMMCIFGKKRPAAVLLLFPLVLYLAGVNIRSMISNIRYGAGIVDSVVMMLRDGTFDFVWFVSCILLAVWYLTGRKKAVGIFAALLTVIALIGGLYRGALIGGSIFLSEYEIYEHRDLLDWPTLSFFLGETDWKTLLFIFVGGWSAAHCILSVQVLQACILSGKMEGQNVKKIPVAAGTAAPTRPVVKAEPAAQEAIKPDGQPKFCRNCGASLPEGSLFCLKCGSKIE